MTGSLSRKALIQGAILRPTTPCFFRAVRHVASTWLDDMNSLEQFTTSTSWAWSRPKTIHVHSFSVMKQELWKKTENWNKSLTLDLLEQTATPTSGIQTMFWIAPEPATTVWRTEPSCQRTYTNGTYDTCGKVFRSTAYINMSVHKQQPQFHNLFIWFLLETCSLSDILYIHSTTVWVVCKCIFGVNLWEDILYPQGPDVHEAPYSSRCQSQTIRAEGQCSDWGDVALQLENTHRSIFWPPGRLQHNHQHQK